MSPNQEQMTRSARTTLFLSLAGFMPLGAVIGYLAKADWQSAFSGGCVGFFVGLTLPMMLALMDFYMAMRRAKEATPTPGLSEAPKLAQGKAEGRTQQQKERA